MDGLTCHPAHQGTIMLNVQFCPVPKICERESSTAFLQKAFVLGVIDLAVQWCIYSTIGKTDAIALSLRVCPSHTHVSPRALTSQVSLPADIFAAEDPLRYQQVHVQPMQRPNRPLGSSLRRITAIALFEGTNSGLACAVSSTASAAAVFGSATVSIAAGAAVSAGAAGTAGAATVSCLLHQLQHVVHQGMLPVVECLSTHQALLAC